MVLANRNAPRRTESSRFSATSWGIGISATGPTALATATSKKEAPLLPVKEDARYPQLLAIAEQNWREENPTLVKSLEKAGTLQKSLESAVELTIVALQQCEKQGLAPDQARELAYQNLLLPSKTRTKMSKHASALSMQKPIENPTPGDSRIKGMMIFAPCSRCWAKTLSSVPIGAVDLASHPP
jgi:hypothetical protein